MKLLPALQNCLPECRDPAGWAPLLEEGLRDFSPAQAAAFIAQVAVESQQLNRLVENLNYRAERLMKIWPKRFPTLAAAADYAGHPEKLANRVYADRLGNGPEATGDGYLYRGRGLLQITGRANYAAAGRALGLPLLAKPQLMEERSVALKSALDFWRRNQLGGLCQTIGDFRLMSTKINGGTHGLPERIEFWVRLSAALGVS